MTRSRTPQELRDRMERVTAKRHQPPEAASKRRTAPRSETTDLDVGVLPARRTRAASARQSDDGVGRQPGEPGTPSTRNAAPPRAHQPPERDVAERRSRLETLVAWGQWELITVPVRRVRWLRAVIRAEDSRTDDPRRGD
ncbi:MAG: hypothetical protein WCB51_01490 [Candidatus Dormiibacterota bacterium]